MNIDNKILYLMHKDYPVASFLADKAGHIKKLIEFINIDRFPIHSVPKNTEQGFLVLQMWENTRVIPNIRQNIGKICDVLGMMPVDAYIKSLKVSLNDCYWFKEKGNPLTWRDVNFYDNGFDNSFFLDIISNESNKIIDFNIPDLTTNGVLEKAWIYINDTPSLIKRGNFGKISEICPDKNILSANEVIASSIGEIMGIDVVRYTPLKIKNETLCICPSYISDSNTDFIPADLFQRYHHTGNNKLYHLLCDLGMKKSVDDMIIFDHIIHNSDRHTFNFGILRNAETLEIKGLAPLFDNGCSFGYSNEREFTKPFTEKRIDQLLLLDYIPDIPDINEIKTCIKNVYKSFDIPDTILSIVFDDLDYSYKIYNDFSQIKEKENYDIEC